MLLISWEDAFPFSYTVRTYMYICIFSPNKLHKVAVGRDLHWYHFHATASVWHSSKCSQTLPIHNLQICRSDFQFDWQPTQWCQVLHSSKSPECQKLRNKRLLTLGAHAQRRLQYLVCVSTTILALQATRRLMSDANSFSATRA